MTRRVGRHCSAPKRAFARALRNRWDKAAAAKEAKEAAERAAEAERAAAERAAAEKAAADKAAADKAMAAFPWYGSGLGVFSHFPLS